MSPYVTVEGNAASDWFGSEAWGPQPG